MADERRDDSRRDFLGRVAKGTLALAAAAGGAAWLYDPRGPQPGADETLVSLGDYAVPHAPGDALSVVQSPDRLAGLRKALDLLGGIERFVKPGERVLIKPNVAFASPPMLGATTHPEMIAALVRLCYDRGGAREVIVTDNPINDPESCFLLSGIGRAATEAGARVVLPRPQSFGLTTLADARLIRRWPLLYEPFRQVDRVIGVAPVKDHHRSGASMSMKNWYGLLGGQRNIFHQDINTIIAELARLVRPTLVVLDGTQVMMSNGPTGGSMADLARRDTVIASCDPVAADAYGASLLDMAVSDLPYLAQAAAAGTGRSDWQAWRPLMAQIS